MKLPDVDGMELVKVCGKNIIMHDAHRFCLVPAFMAQRSGSLARPATLICLDRHHDAVEVRNSIESVVNLAGRSLSENYLIDNCSNDIGKFDDDWIKRGMELRIIGDTVVLGVDDRSDAHKWKEYNDSRGGVHQTHIHPLPEDGLGYQGYLWDLATRESLSELWKILEWDPQGDGFRPSANGWWLNIDLDLFVVKWKKYFLPWPDEIYLDEFSDKPGHPPLGAWSGCSVFAYLFRNASMVTVARETLHCGGQSKANQIWDDVQRVLFGRCCR